MNSPLLLPLRWRKVHSVLLLLLNQLGKAMISFGIFIFKLKTFWETSGGVSWRDNLSCAVTWSPISSSTMAGVALTIIIISIKLLHPSPHLYSEHEVEDLWYHEVLGPKEVLAAEDVFTLMILIVVVNDVDHLNLGKLSRGSGRIFYLQGQSQLWRAEKESLCWWRSWRE